MVAAPAWSTTIATVAGKTGTLTLLLGTSLATFRLLFLRPRDEWQFLQTYDDDENFLAVNVTQRPWFTPLVNVVEPVSLAVKKQICLVTVCDAWSFRVAAWALHTLAASVICLVHHPFPAFVLLVHPFAVEVVLWPSAFGYPLAVVLCVFATALYEARGNGLRKQEEHDASGYRRASLALLVCILYASASFSKAPAVVWPAVFVGLTYLKEVEGRGKEQGVSPLTFFAEQLSSPLIQCLGVLCLVIVAAIALANGDGANVDADTIQLDTRQRWSKFAAVIAESAARTVVPAFLRPHYRVDLDALDPSQHPLMAVEASIVAVASAAAISRIFARSSRHASSSILAVTWGLFVILLLPASGLVVQHGIVQRGAGEDVSKRVRSIVLSTPHPLRPLVPVSLTPPHPPPPHPPCDLANPRRQVQLLCAGRFVLHNWPKNQPTV